MLTLINGRPARAEGKGWALQARASPWASPGCNESSASLLAAEGKGQRGWIRRPSLRDRAMLRGAGPALGHLVINIAN